ncbi:MAG: tetratricopeptide repeat protein [bacterium]
MRNLFNIIGLTLIILLTSCTQEYKLERMYYHAYKKYIQISKNPSSATPSQIDQVIADFKKIINLSSKNFKGGNIQYTIGHLYFLKNDFKKARQELNEFISDFSYQRENCLTAKFLIGLSYEQENKWDNALVIFKEIMKDYPLSLIAIDLPHHIAQYYEGDKKYQEAEKTLRDAIVYYDKIINSYPSNKKLVMIMEDKILQTYEKLDDWQRMINTLRNMIDIYPHTERGAQALYQLAKIYEDRKKTKEAIFCYEQFIQDYPHHNLKSVAREKIHALKIILPVKSE